MLVQIDHSTPHPCLTPCRIFSLGLTSSVEQGVKGVKICSGETLGFVKPDPAATPHIQNARSDELSVKCGGNHTYPPIVAGNG